MRIWRGAFSRGGSVPCLLGGIGRAASVPHQQTRTNNIGPQKLGEYLTAKDSSIISAVLRDCIKHTAPPQRPLCQDWLSFHFGEGGLCGQLISPRC